MNRAALRWSLPLALLLVLAAAAASAGPRSAKRLDAIWVHPEFARHPIDRIAMLPVATYDNSLEAAGTVEQSFGQAFHNTGYRWISASSCRSLLRARGGDSLVTALSGRMLQRGRVDSSDAIALCAWFHVGAVLGVRVDQWDRQQVEWNQSGRSYTQIAATASLVDSTGRLLWRLSGSQRGEGAYNDPNAPVAGVTSSGLDFKPITAQAGAPSYAEVALALFTRWALELPSLAPADSAAGSHP